MIEEKTKEFPMKKEKPLHKILSENEEVFLTYEGYWMAEVYSGPVGDHRIYRRRHTSKAAAVHDLVLRRRTMDAFASAEERARV